MLFRDTSARWRYITRTQGNANWFSEYMQGRQYKYSVYQQVINAFSIQFDQLNNALYRQLRNRFPQTFLPDTIDVIYTAVVPDDFSKLEYFDGSTWIESTKSLFTDSESWWYDTVPTGVGIAETTDTHPIILNQVALQPRFTFANENISPASGIYIILEADEDATFIDNRRGKDPRRMEVRLFGVDTHGVKRSELYTFSNIGMKRSRTSWSKIEKIETLYFDDPTKFDLTVATFIPNTYLLREDQHLLHPDPDRTLKTIYWDKSLDSSKLQMKVFSARNIMDYHAGVRDFEIIKEFTLYLDDTTPVVAIDSILPSETSSQLFVLADDHLLCYDKYEDYSPLAGRATEIKSSDPVLDIDAIVNTGEISIKGLYNKIHTNKFIAAYSISVIKEDGTIQSWRKSDNTWISAAEYFNDYEYKTVYGFISPTAVYGDGTPFNSSLIIRLDTRLTNGTVETDTYIVERQIKKPSFASDIGYAADASLTYSNDGFLQISDPTTERKLYFKNNQYLYDEDKKTVILKDSFSSIRFKDISNQVISTVTPTPFNVFNELDQYGALLYIERALNEKSFLFNRRLQESFYHPGNSTKLGLIYGLSRELKLEVSESLFLSSASYFDIKIKNQIAIVETDEIENIVLLDITIGDFKTALEALGITVTTINSNTLTLPARTLLDCSSVKSYYNQSISRSSRIELPIDENEELIEATVFIEGMNWVVDEAALDLSIDPSFAVILPNIILLNKTADYTNRLRYKTRAKTFSLEASPVIVGGFLSLEDTWETFYDSYGNVIVLTDEQILQVRTEMYESFYNDYTVKLRDAALSDIDIKYPSKWAR